MSQSMENKVIIDGQTFYGGLNQPNLKFVKVNVDCWERIFDLLSLRDILAMSQTCQRMRQIGGHYFRENFHGTECSLRSSGPRIGGNPVKRDDFLRFVDTIEIFKKMKPLRRSSSMGLLSSLTTLHLRNVHLNKNQFIGFENIQSKIETIKLSSCTIGDNSVGEFLASCPKLKCLRFNRATFESATAKASLFQRTYPMLEHFVYILSGEMGELASFLERNPKIKELRISDGDLRGIPHDKSTIQLDYLNTYIERVTDANELLNRLKTLHANGFFKKLRMSITQGPDGFDGEMFTREMASFSALEVLEVFKPYTNAMCHLTQLKELHLRRLHYGADLETMAVKLINLERLRIRGSVDQLTSFLRHSKKLKFVFFHDANHNCSALNLFNLNRVRQMSGMQRKVKIGFYEEQNLKLKCKEKNVNYDFVEITRFETIRKYFDYFDCFD